MFSNDRSYFVAQKAFLGWKLIRKLPTLDRAIDFAQDLARNARNPEGETFDYLVGDTDGNVYAKAYGNGSTIFCGFDTLLGVGRN